MKNILKSTLALSLVASTLLASTSIELDPIIEEIVPGKRIVVNATITDEAGVNVARTYFKAADGANYSFVPMSCEASACSATLPAVSNATKSIDYLVLVKNANNEVYKTQTFNALSLPLDASMPSYQTEPTDSVIKVKTELAQAPEMVEGFSDNIALDSVQDIARLGVVAGITAGTTTSTAVSAGTIAATGAGVSTTAIVVGGVVAVAAGGAAVASSSSSSSTPAVSSSSSDSSKESTTSPESNNCGYWSGYSKNDIDGSYNCETLLINWQETPEASYSVCNGYKTGYITRTSCKDSSGSFSWSKENGMTGSGTVTNNSSSNGVWTKSDGSTGITSLTKD